MGIIVFIFVVLILIKVFSKFSQSSTLNNVDARRPVKSQNEFGPINYYANVKRPTKDKWFQFTYKRNNGIWYMYIDRMPSLNRRDSNLHITHRYFDPNVQKYHVCYDPKPTSLADAIIISKSWADREMEYINSGTIFEKQRW